MMKYKGYLGDVEFDDDAGIFHGEVINTRDVITFQGKDVSELKAAFRESVDDYLAFCRERGEPPDKPFSGQFVVRISPDLHRQISFIATSTGKSLNAWVSEQLQAAVARRGIEAFSSAREPPDRGPSTGRGKRKSPIRGKPKQARRSA